VAPAPFQSRFEILYATLALAGIGHRPAPRTRTRMTGDTGSVTTTEDVAPEVTSVSACAR
jgi:hypothetical protein